MALTLEAHSLPLEAQTALTLEVHSLPLEAQTEKVA